MSDGIQNILAKAKKTALIIGLAASFASAMGYMSGSEEFFRTYLISFMFWLGLSLGALAIIMVHHLAGGRWGFASRRICEAATQVLPLMAILFIPIYVGRHELFSWMGHYDGAHHEVVEAKSGYLNEGFFTIRAIFYFVIWIGLARLLVRPSYKQDETGDASINTKLARLSPPGLIIYLLTVTFAATDWVMSLEPAWFSSIYGVLFLGGQVLSMLALSIIVLATLRKKPPFVDVLKPVHFHDLGNLMFAFTMFWAYISFSQYIIIWSGNLPEEIPWYLHRSGNGLVGLAIFIALFHFAVPFVIMLSRISKQRAHIVRIIAVWMFAVRFVDLHWLITPAFYPKTLHIHWLDFVMPIAMGGLWLSLFFTKLSKQSLLPRHDPRFPLEQH